ncbi:GntR family transcriptional regulator [Phytomonospora sp. NPDC050363]|uniref:GntR family transcriptional regulator n=1 Tax=Phytomonospora sp. NPDC050363 TaxID=3155642 RepID=UPI0034105149
MEPQRTPVDQPKSLQVADDLRLQIERGDLAPGDALPTIADLSARWGYSVNVVRDAFELLKAQGLVSGGRGRPAKVRVPLRRIVRSSDRHQEEKDLVLLSEEERRGPGAAETLQLQFTATYEEIRADVALAEAFGIDEGAKLLQRIYETTDPATRQRQSWSVSYLPHDLISANPALLDSANEPWPGGTQHQLHTVGVEVVRVVDEVAATMPTTVDLKLWGMEKGVPLLKVRRISFDETGRVVEISDADYPADRTELRFTIPLAKW